MDKLLSISTVILLILTFFFGDNIIDNFQSAKLAYSTSKIEIKNNASSTDSSNDIKFFRQVVISNIGTKPSIDIAALISLDGDVYSYDVSSIEQYNVLKNQNASFYFSMPRLTKGASITLKFWMKSGHNDFKINATDNKEAINFISYDQANNRAGILRLINVILLLSALFFMFYLFKHKPLINAHTNMSLSYQELLEKHSILDATKHELELKVEELSQIHNRTHIADDLLEFLKRRGAN